MNFVEGNGNIHVYGGGLGYGVLPPTAAKGLIPTYVSGGDDMLLPAKETVKSEGGVSYVVPVGKKRSWDYQTITHHPFVRPRVHVENLENKDQLFGQDLIRQHLWEIDSFLSQHKETVRMEMEEKRRNRSGRIMALLRESIGKKFQEKEEEMEKMNEVNMALEERVKSLCVENDIWRELAHSSEATANALRTNLQQLLAQQHDTEPLIQDDKAESCCGSNYSGQEKINGGGRADEKRAGCICISCWKEEASMLLLPCRHLCLCYGCGQLLHRCPLCNSLKNGCIHVLL